MDFMMKSTQDFSQYVDLSHLTTEEELAIRQVLQRDENLKRRETGRIRLFSNGLMARFNMKGGGRVKQGFLISTICHCKSRLQHSIPDPKKLKVMTGEWFQELRTRRYGWQSDVTDVLRSSMKKKKTTAFRNDQSTNVEQNIGDEEKNKTSEIQKPYTSFFNPAFREEADQKMYNQESNVDIEKTFVDIPEQKVKLCMPHEGPAGEEDPTKPFTLPNQHIPGFSTTENVLQTPENEPGQKNDTGFSHDVPESAVEVLPSIDRQNKADSSIILDVERSSFEYKDNLGLESFRLNQDDLIESLQTDEGKNILPGSIPSLFNEESKLSIITTENHDPVDTSLVRKPGSPERELMFSLEDSSIVAHRPLDDILVSSDLCTQKDTKEKYKCNTTSGKDEPSDTEMFSSVTYETKLESRVPPKEVGEEQKQIREMNASESKPTPNGNNKIVDQKTGQYPIPTIMVDLLESPSTEEAEEVTAVTQDTPSMAVKPMDTWEDEVLDSDDDQSSVSSYGSDFVPKRGVGSNALAISGRTESQLSVYSEAGEYGSVTVRGAVEFALRYTAAGEMIITVEQCQDLAYASPRKQRTDPYVKTYLHPDKSRNSKRKTTIKKHTNNPVYGGEKLKYSMKMEDLKGRTLNLSVWHNDFRGRNVFLGEVNIDLKTWDWEHEVRTWYNLQPKNPEGQESSEYHGLLMVALKYVPPGSTGNAKANSGEIHVWLKEARNLRKLKPQVVDSFVKCYMLPDTSKKSRQKTRVVKKSQDPVYNHTMVYDGFRVGEVREACCELTVWEHNTLSNQFLGGVHLSMGTGQSYGKKVDWMDSVNEEITLWEKMLSSPGVWVEGEIPLRSSMSPRK